MEGCDDECSEDIDVDHDHSQPADTSNNAKNGETPTTAAQSSLDSNTLTSGSVSAVQDTSEAGGSSQENLLQIQQQMREQQRQMMAMSPFEEATASSNKGESPGAESGSESGTTVNNATGSSSNPTRPGASLNGEDSCSDVEGESEQDMMLIMMRGSRESAQDNELEQQVRDYE